MADTRRNSFLRNGVTGGIVIGNGTLDPNAVGTRFNAWAELGDNIGVEYTGQTTDTETVQVSINFSAASNTSGTNGTRVAILRANTQGSTTGNRGGTLIFFTKPDASGLVEAMRIANTQNLLIGTSTDSGYKLDVTGVARCYGLTSTTGSFSSAVTLSSGSSLNFASAVNVAFSGIAGNKLGTTTGQKIGFWNATPVVRPAGWGGTTGTVTRSQLDTSTATAGDVAQRLAALINDLTTIGLIGA